MMIDRTDITMLQREVWGRGLFQITQKVVHVVDDGVYDPVYDVLHQIEDTIEEELQ